MEALLRVSETIKSIRVRHHPDASSFFLFFNGPTGDTFERTSIAYRVF